MGSRTRLIEKGIEGSQPQVASDMRLLGRMKSYIVDTIRRLLELHALEERLSVFQRNHQKVTDAQALLRSLRANLPVGVMFCHDRMRAQGKRSVAEVRHGVCSGCHMAVSTGLLGALRHCDTLHRCENCERYLYLVEEEEADRQPARRELRHAATVSHA
jgi:predicted  nucleic acid-binding Zn-ribbon protein